MGFMDWLMKGVDSEQQEEAKTAEFDDDAIENLKKLSDSEMQESTTLNSPQDTMMSNQNAYFNTQNNFNQVQNGATINQQQYMQQYQNVNQFSSQNPMQMQNSFGTPLNTMQNVYMQQSPNQPFTQTTITIFQISSEEDIQFALMHLGKKSPCAIAFNKMNRKKFNSLYQYLNGGVFALGAKIVKWDNNYLLTPRGMNISKQERAKR